jgi:hypothetical protein
LGDLSLLKILKSLGVLSEPSLEIAQQTDNFARIDDKKETLRPLGNRRHTRFPNSHPNRRADLLPNGVPRRTVQDQSLEEKPKSRPVVNVSGHLHSREPVTVDILRKALPIRFAAMDANVQTSGLDADEGSPGGIG